MSSKRKKKSAKEKERFYLGEISAPSVHFKFRDLPSTLEEMLDFIKEATSSAIQWTDEQKAHAQKYSGMRADAVLITDQKEDFIIPIDGYIGDPLDSILLKDFLSQQNLIPELQIEDIYPTEELTLDRLRLYQDIQIFRDKCNSADGIKLLSAAEKYKAVVRLAEKIPLKLANPEAHDALSRIISRADPFTKRQIREILLPRLFFEQRNKEPEPKRRRISRTEYIRTSGGNVAVFRPIALPLIEYWKWLEDRVQEALEKSVLELEIRDISKKSKRASSPVLLGTQYGKFGEITNETEEYEKNKKKGRKPKAEIIYSSTYDIAFQKSRKRRYEAIGEASPDEANFEISPDAGGGFELTNTEAYEFAADAFEDDIADCIDDLKPAIEDLQKSIHIDAATVIETIKLDVNKGDKKYLIALAKILHDDPGLSILEAREKTREKLKIRDNNEYQIFSRIKHRSSVRARKQYFDGISVQGHPLLRPDGTKMMVPAWVFGFLRRMHLLLDSPGQPPKLSPGIYAVLGNTEKSIPHLRLQTHKRMVRKPLVAADTDYANDVRTTVDASQGDLRGISQAAIARLIRILGRNLEGPGENIKCDCPECNF
jgi:hypothetical protein